MFIETIKATPSAYIFCSATVLHLWLGVNTMNRTLGIFALIICFCYGCADADPLHVMTTKAMVSSLKIITGYGSTLYIGIDMVFCILPIH